MNRRTRLEKRIPTAVQWIDDRMVLIDQTLLPRKLKYIRLKTLEAVAEAIKSLRVRGAPAIGVAAAYGVVVGMRSERKKIKNLRKRFERVYEVLRSTRPTAVNLFWALERMKQVFDRYFEIGINEEEMMEALLEEARMIHRDDEERCRRIGEYGAEILQDGDVVLTHCHAGALATGGLGTALSVIYTAVQQGKRIRVYADETRPLLQGARITSWELKSVGVDVTLICDNMAATVMKEGRVSKVIVGADRIAANGDTANKIGTYGVALLAHYHKIPFYVAAPFSTIDFQTPTGDQIPIEERSPREVVKPYGLQIAPLDVKVYNPAFDVTPARLITGIITDHGMARKPFKASLKRLFQQK